MQIVIKNGLIIAKHPDVQKIEGLYPEATIKIIENSHHCSVGDPDPTIEFPSIETPETETIEIHCQLSFKYGEKHYQITFSNSDSASKNGNN